MNLEEILCDSRSKKRQNHHSISCFSSNYHEYWHKMISGSRDQSDFTAKPEGSTSDNNNNINKQQIPSITTTASWSRLKDPRIVRVSRAFGGKDRHSKVCTVKGLRDRRVRLSVPTAIQLYDLQDRLGLNQPSKAVDWLLNAAKNEIDELPPLQMPPGNFGQSLQPMMLGNSHLVSQNDKLEGLRMNNSSLNWEDPLQLSRSNYSNQDKSKDVGKRIDQEGTDQNGGFVSSSNFFSRANHSSSSSSSAAFLNNVGPNNPFLRWDPSNLSLSQFGSHGLSSNPNQGEDVHRFNVVSMPNPNLSALPSGSHQLLAYPPQMQSYFPSHVSNSSGEINFQMLSSNSSQNPLRVSATSLTPPIYAISQGARPNFQLSMNPNFFSSQNNSNNEQTEDS